LQERLTRGTVTSTMRRAAHTSGCARCGAGAGCSAIQYQYLQVTDLEASEGEHADLGGDVAPVREHRTRHTEDSQGQILALAF